VSYPCCAGEAAGIRLQHIPSWAGRLEAEGGTLIVLGWSPGYYLLEGDGPGTRFLSTFPRHLGARERAELLADLRDPHNRWALAAGVVPLSNEVSEVLQAEYENVQSPSALWRRRSATPP
jgi:hypothetical protein